MSEHNTPFGVRDANADNVNSDDYDPDDIDLDDIDETAIPGTKRKYGMSQDIYGLLSPEHKKLVRAHKVLSGDPGRAARALFRRYFLIKPPNGKRVWWRYCVHSNGQWFGRADGYWTPVTHDHLHSFIADKLHGKPGLGGYYRLKLTRRQGIVVAAELLPWSTAPHDVDQVVAALAAPGYTGVSAPGWITDYWGNRAGDEYTRHAHLMPCANGLVDIDTRTVITHPLYFNTWCSDVHYDEAAPEPVAWLRMLNDQWADDPAAIACLQEWFGYVLSGRTDLQKILMLVGPPGSGKGIITRVLEALLGHGVKATSIKSLCNDFGLQSLVGASLAVMSDVVFTGRDTTLAVERLKAISGEDDVVVNRKNLPEITTRIRARFMIIGNEIMRLADNSAALGLRMLPLETTRGYRGTEDADPNLEPAIMRELAGILNWAFVGMDRLNANGGQFTMSKDAEELFERIRNLGSTLADFVADHYMPVTLASVDDRNHDIAISDAYAMYKESLGRGQVAMVKSRFRESLATYLRAKYPAGSPAVKRINDGDSREYVLRGMRAKPDDPMARGRRNYASNQR